MSVSHRLFQVSKENCRVSITAGIAQKTKYGNKKKKQFAKGALTHDALQREGWLPTFASAEADRHQLFRRNWTF